MFGRIDVRPRRTYEGQDVPASAPARCRPVPWTALFAALAAGCAHAPQTQEPPPAETKPTSPKDELVALLASAYQSLEQGDADALAAVLTTDAMAYGLGPSDTLVSRDEVATRLGQQLLPLSLGGQRLSVASRAVVGLAEGGRSAWVYDLPTVTLEGPSGRSEWLPRLTAHALKDEDGWHLDALHVSLGVPDELVLGPDAAKKLLPPADVSPDRGRGADELVGLTRRLLEDFSVKVKRLSPRVEFVEIGSAPSETFEGGEHFRALVTPQLLAIAKAGYSWRLDGGLRTRLAPGGRTGWATGNVVMRVGKGASARVLPTVRALWIFVEEQGRWNLASEHQSLGVKEDLRLPATEDELKAARARRAAP